MKRSTTLAAFAILALGALWLGGSRPVEAEQGVGQALAGPPITREPIVIYDVTGSTIAGPYHLSLEVYNDGLATIASAGFLNPPEGRASAILVTAAEAESLRQALLLNGAGYLVDNPQAATDSPITTVTFFAQPAAKAKANTYSYYFPSPPQLPVQQILQAFIDEHFPQISG